MKHIKNIITIIKQNRADKRQREEVKTRIMADHVEPTLIPNIYKVSFNIKIAECHDKYNLYDTNENKLLFSQCKHTLQHLKYGLYFVKYYNKSAGWTWGIYDITTKEFVKDFVSIKHMSIDIRQFPNKNTDNMLLQTNDEIIVFNLKTKAVERVIGI